MTTLCVVTEHYTLPIAEIFSAPEKVPPQIFYDLILLIQQWQENFTLFKQAFTFVHECNSALKECKIEGDGWHPKPRIEDYIKKVKNEYEARQEKGILREEGPVEKDGPVGDRVLIEEEDFNKEKTLASLGQDLYAGGGAKALFIFRNLYDDSYTNKRKILLNTMRSWPSKLREASGKKLSELESHTKIETWCDGDARYQRLKIEIDGTLSQSKDATPQHDEAGNSEHSRLHKRRRQDPPDSQQDGEGVQPQSTNTQSSSHTEASTGSEVQQGEVRRVQDVYINRAPNSGIQPQQPQPPQQQPPQGPTPGQPPKSQPTPFDIKRLKFMKKAVPNPLLPQNKGKPTAWRLLTSDLSCFLQKYLGSYKWAIHGFPQKEVCITASQGIGLILGRHSPLDLARYVNGPAATYADLLALSLTTRCLCDYILSRLGSETELHILYILGVPQVFMPPGIDGVLLFSKNAFGIIGTEVDTIRDAEKSQA